MSARPGSAAQAMHDVTVQPAAATMATARAASPHAAADRPMPAPAAAPQTRDSTADTVPRLSIGRIEVTVLSASQPARTSSRPAGDDAFLSRHYLRRL